MKLKRRSLIKLICSVSFFSLFKPLTAAAGPSHVERTLASMIEMLLPITNFNSVAYELLKVNTLATNKGKLFIWGSRWLDQQSRGLFHNAFVFLTEQQKIEIINTAQQSKKSSLEYQFYLILRNDVMTMFYASEAGNEYLKLESSPQPNGYPDHTQPPRKRDYS